MMLARRGFLRWLGAGAALAASVVQSRAGQARIDKLIAAAQAQTGMSQRIDFISCALLGTSYESYTLIGSPYRPEKFVVRDDAFDCVTFCETVLAGALSRAPGEFAEMLRAIRYHDGIVAWPERNHYFFEWSQHNIENQICRPVAMDGSIEIEKTVYWHKALGRRSFAMQVIPRAVLLDNVALLRSGDIIGFVTERPNLDFFHIGFVAFGDGGELLLRHAAKSRGEVLDERMARFVAHNRVRYVTLLRPQEARVVV